MRLSNSIIYELLLVKWFIAPHVVTILYLTGLTSKREMSEALSISAIILTVSSKR